MAVVTWVLSAGSVAFADKALLLTCEQALTHLSGRIGRFASDRYYGSAPITRAPTVAEVSSRPGPRGGRLIQLRRIGAQWVSNHRTVGYDPQGDPRWFISVVGEEAARFFGFRMIDEDHCEVPDATEFNGAIAAMNQRLREAQLDPIPITFYETPDNDNVRVAEYVRRFRDHAAIPLARSGNHLLHDLSFHTAAIFFPPEVVRFKQNETAYLEAFIAHLERAYADDPRRTEALRHFAFAWRTVQTSSIDSGTGTLAPVLVSLMTVDSRTKLSLLHGTVSLMSGSGLTHFEFNAEVIQELNESTERNNRVVFTWPRTKKIRASLHDLTKDELTAQLSRFDHEYGAGPHAGREPHSSARYAGGAEADRLCLEVNKRRAIIADLARGLTPDWSPTMPSTKLKATWIDRLRRALFR